MIADVCLSVCVCVGVNWFVLSLSDDSVDADLSLYQALKHCSQLGALAIINADTHSSFVALVRPLSHWKFISKFYFEIKVSKFFC